MSKPSEASLKFVGDAVRLDRRARGMGFIVVWHPDYWLVYEEPEQEEVDVNSALFKGKSLGELRAFLAGVDASIQRLENE